LGQIVVPTKLLLQDLWRKGRAWVTTVDNEGAKSTEIMQLWAHVTEFSIPGEINLFALLEHAENGWFCLTIGDFY
jgi:hypothetical protein